MMMILKESRGLITILAFHRVSLRILPLATTRDTILPAKPQPLAFQHTHTRRHHVTSVARNSQPRWGNHPPNCLPTHATHLQKKNTQKTEKRETGRKRKTKMVKPYKPLEIQGHGDVNKWGTVVASLMLAY